MPFNDWRKLPPLTPLSRLCGDMKELLEEEIRRVTELFQEGRSQGIIQSDGRLTGTRTILDGRGVPEAQEQILLDSFWQAPALQQWVEEELQIRDKRAD